MQRTMTVGDRKPEGYTYESIKQRLSGVKWNIAFAIDRCTYKLAWQIALSYVCYVLGLGHHQ